ncbi:MAG: methionine--tRNA ligase [Leptospirales bacterium]|nr:methionine--tRNA ligase [Leptospirales bacterium]
MTQARRILVTAALPYANGPIHLGHLVEYIQTDIWVRYQRLRGAEVYFFCADDTHGTPVMIAAQRLGITPQQLVERVHGEHLRDLQGFLVNFAHFYSTNSPENKALAEQIYRSARDQGAIARRNVQQLYCQTDSMFLPDRFVRGQCPNCASLDQYGDSCEVCGATYAPRDLKEPHCAICGTTPVERESEHLFFRLPLYQEYLKKWLHREGRVDSGVRKKLDEWLQGELREWDISRDGPYFGFEIPDEPNKYFYVWLDAPIGYMAAARNYFDRQGRPDLFEIFWKSEESEVYHFIGKDIVYFHTLFWPALLRAGGFRTPSAVYVHGFLTLNGEKMSKSRGTLIRAETFLKHLNPEALRYFYAARLSDGLDDLDLSQTDFLQRYNAEVVGAIVNIFSRLAGLSKKLERRLAAGPSPAGRKLAQTVREAAPTIQTAFEGRDYARAIREINAAAASINRFVNESAPWNIVAAAPEEARQTITDALNASLPLLIYLKPVLPALVENAERMLGIAALDYQTLHQDLPPNQVIGEYVHLAQRIEEAQFKAMLAEEAALSGEIGAQRPAPVIKNKSESAQEKKVNQKEESDATQSGIIQIEDLSKVDLCVGRILSAQLIEGADRLLAIQLDVGEQRPRSVIAGIRAAYQPADLTDLLVVCVANLAPRKMKFGVSEAMLLATGEGAQLTLFAPHRSANPGDRLR